MIIFYTQNINGDLAFLEDVEHKHCTRVLRKKVGDSVSLIDGNGGFFEGIITEITKKETQITIEKKRVENPHSPYLHLAIAPTKNMSRFEWFLEKATEIGINEITPILCDHSERKTIKMDRCETILLTAAKQSLKAHLPILNKLTLLSEFLSNDNQGNKLIASYAPENPDITDFKKQNSTILIGPEGDFSPKELDISKENDWINVNLSTYRLRTETAGIVACTLMNN